MHFHVKALSSAGAVVSLSIDAVGEQEALQQLKGQGYSVLAVRPARSPLGFPGRPRKHFQLVLFSQETLALLDAGLNLVEAVETLAEKEHRDDTRKMLGRIVAALYQGQPFSQALGQFPEVFPPLYIATVRASEKTGNLSEALSRFVNYQTQLDLVRKKIVGASIYPLLLMGMGGLVSLFLLGYVVPKFSSIYQELGKDLPFLSQLLLEWGRMLASHGVALGAAFGAVVAGLAYGFTRPAFKEWLVARLWQLPVVGERLRIYQLARFYRTVGMLLRGGVPMVSALGMVSGLLQPALRHQLELASTALREGRAVSEAMHACGLTTPIAQRMLRVGERTGRMGEMMERIASFYDEEMARWVDWFTRLFEPLLMAVIGFIIGGIVILMYLPIFELAGSLE